MMKRIELLTGSGELEEYTLRASPFVHGGARSFHSRTAYAAAHVVVDPVRTRDPMSPVLDWEATLRYREHLWECGFAVAEAMDTSQRGTGLDWTLARELIERSARVAQASGHRIACGAGTDQLAPDRGSDLQDIVHAYEEQCAVVEAVGSRVILMASRALARVARDADDYHDIYSRILDQVKQPVILHWLGPMFDPQLEGYWGSTDIDSSMQSCLWLIKHHAEKIDGVKLSLLNPDFEVKMRRQLPATVKMYTGDDFNYDRLIEGDEVSYSHALLGILDAIAPVASAALEALDRGDTETYRRLLAPTVPLSRCVFAHPTYYYKTGIVFLAFINGFQNHFRMVAGHESARSISHLCEIFRLADQAGLIRDPELALARMKTTLSMAGVA